MSKSHGLNKAYEQLEQYCKNKIGIPDDIGQFLSSVEGSRRSEMFWGKDGATPIAASVAQDITKTHHGPEILKNNAGTQEARSKTRGTIENNTLQCRGARVYGHTSTAMHLSLIHI